MAIEENPTNVYWFYAIKVIVILGLAVIFWMAVEIAWLNLNSLMTNKYKLHIKQSLPLGMISLPAESCDKDSKSIEVVLDEIIKLNKTTSSEYAYTNPFGIANAEVLSSNREYGLAKNIPIKTLRTNIFSVVNYINDALNTPYTITIEPSKVYISKRHSDDKQVASVDSYAEYDNDSTSAYIHCTLKHLCPAMFAETTPNDIRAFIYEIARLRGLNLPNPKINLDYLVCSQIELTRPIDYALCSICMESLLKDRNTDSHAIYLLYVRMKKSPFSDHDANFSKLDRLFHDHSVWVSGNSNKASTIKFGQIVLMSGLESIHIPQLRDDLIKSGQDKVCLSFVKTNTRSAREKYVITSFDSYLGLSGTLKRAGVMQMPQGHNTLGPVLKRTTIGSMSKTRFKDSLGDTSFFNLYICSVPYYIKLDNSILLPTGDIVQYSNDVPASVSKGEYVYIINNGKAIAKAEIVEDNVDMSNGNRRLEYVGLRDEAKPNVFYGYYGMRVKEIYEERIVLQGAPVIKNNGDYIGIIPNIRIPPRKTLIDSYYVVFPGALHLIDAFVHEKQGQ